MKENYKTELCTNYESNGNCLRGSNCFFAHGNKELRKPFEQPLEVYDLFHQKKYKTEKCRHYEAYGSCLRGDHCHYAHGEDELRNPLKEPEDGHEELISQEQIYKAPHEEEEEDEVSDANNFQP